MQILQKRDAMVHDMTYWNSFMALTRV
jgi:hypothetical protein